MKTIRIASIAVVLVLATAAFFFFRKGGDAGAQAFRLAAVTRGDLSSSVSATGQLSAVTTVQVGTQVSGQVAEIYADFNDHVKKGQLLARIDPTLAQQAVADAQAGVDRARAELSQAQADYDRNKPLYDQKVITASEFQGYDYKLQVARADLRSAQVQLEKARQQLAYTNIYAPMDGVIVRRTANVGQTVAASFSAPELFLIARDLSQMQILAQVDESDIGSIHQGQPVSFTVQAYPDQKFTGTVSQVRLQSSTQENVVDYTVVVSVDNPGGKLMPGMTATVDFITGGAQDALMVPNAALRFRPTPDMLSKAAQDSAAAHGWGQGGSRRGSAQGGASGGQGGSGRWNGQGGSGAQGGHSGHGSFGRLWTVGADGKLTPVPVHTGLTDGKMTVVTGAKVKPGMQVVIASTAPQASQSGQQGTTNPFQPQRRGPGGPRGGF
jgi:HlyD family secretion protein